MAYGYAGRVLHVDLTTGSLIVETPPETFYRTYMGGSALALYYLLREMPAGIDPLGPGNIMVLALSVITGAPISGQSRLTIAAKSPQSEGIGDSQSGGFFPAEMKAAGFDAIVIRGRSDHPVYLWLHDGEAELRDADHLWGLETGDTLDRIKLEIGDQKIRVVQIGPAGEKLARLASIISDTSHANGRTGMGAVMGSKNLKAVVVRGTAAFQSADKEALSQLARWGAKHFADSDAASLGKYGTAGIINSQSGKGGLPTRNYSSGFFAQANDISGETMYETILQKRETCYACVIRCKRVVSVPDGPLPVDPRYGGPEYETTAAFGSYCGFNDLNAIAKANEICARFGLDSISTGATIAWAMDAYEHGYLTQADTDGLDLHFGNAAAMVQLTEKIARRDGIGDLLAEGSARAAEQIGRGSETLVVAVKRQELPAHMPQVKRSLALIYAVNPFGADHQSSEHDGPYEQPGAFDYYAERLLELDLQSPQPRYSLQPGKVRYAYYTEIVYSLLDTLNVCQFVFGPTWQLYDTAQLVETVKAVTGWPVTLYELMKVGERRLNMMRAFNAREGIGREADKLPPKLYQPLKGGKSDGMAVSEAELEQAKDWYYAMAGWDVASGRPKRGKLSELGLDWVADLLNLP